MAAATAQDNWSYIYNLMRRLKFSEMLSMLIADMCAHETANFTSNVFRNDKNASGIKWINKPYQKAGKGTKIGSGFYARYSTLDDWAKDLQRIFSGYSQFAKDKNGIISIYATNAETKLPSGFHQMAMRFANILKAHKYYQAPVTQYYNGLVAAHRAYQPQAVLVSHQKEAAKKQAVNAPKTASGNNAGKDKGKGFKMPDIPLAGWIAAGLAISLLRR